MPLIRKAYAGGADGLYWENDGDALEVSREQAQLLLRLPGFFEVQPGSVPPLPEEPPATVVVVEDDSHQTIHETLDQAVKITGSGSRSRGKKADPGQIVGGKYAVPDGLGLKSSK